MRRGGDVGDGFKVSVPLVDTAGFASGHDETDEDEG
jgi:hypothetical protein